MRLETETLGALTLVAASAGSGKTHYLTQIVTHALDPATPNAIGMAGLVGLANGVQFHHGLGLGAQQR